MSKKIFALLLAAIMLLSCCPAGLTAFAANRAEADIPIIWVVGGNGVLYSADGREVYPVEEPDGYIADAVKDCLPSFFNAIMFGDIKTYNKKFNEWMAPLYTDVILDKNGECVNGVHDPRDMETQWINPNSANCDLQRYVFGYDFRLDPYTAADSLARYIERLKATTGSDEVNLYGRCEGATVIAAYLDAYGDAGIHKIGLNASAFNGNENVSKSFSGKIKIDADMGDVYVSSEFIVGDDLVNQYFWELWDALRDTYGIELTVAVANRLYNKVIKKVIPDFLLNSYGTFPGAWAMLCEEDYQDALDYIFYNDTIREEYKGLYEKITHYHDCARANFEDNLLKFKEKGGEVGIFAKYGFAAKPLFERCDEIGDGDIKLVDESFGATTAKWGETLSDKYIAEAKEKGTDKYISADKQVDASTCLFPETTWIYKNCFHGWFTEGTNVIPTLFFHTVGMTVDTYEQYPQYNVFHLDDDSVVPMTEENCNTEEENILDGAQASNSGFFKAIFKLFRVIRNFLALLRSGEAFSFSFAIKNL